LVAGIALHPYIVGQPFRLRHLRRALEYLASHRDRVWLTHPGSIASHFASL
jgi:allantoinase